MADVSRAEFDALVARVSALESTPAAPVTPPARHSAIPPTVSVEGSTYKLSGTFTAGPTVKLAYLQLAVRGAGATDLDLHPGARVKAGQSVVLSGTGKGSGDYVAWIAWSVDGSTWTDGPRSLFTVTAPPVGDVDPPQVPEPPTPTPDPTPDPAPAPGERAIPIVGASGLGFNSLVFRQKPAAAKEFGERRGVAMDGLLYFTPRRGWDDFRQIPDRAGQAQWLAEGKIIVTSMPHAPESEGDAMNQRGAEDAYRGEQRALGKWLAENGFNQPTHVLRVDWECNGNWYKWSANRPGGPGALRQAIANYVTNIRAGGATKVKFDLCFNKGPNQAGAAFEIFPGPEFIDVIGIDQYDMWSPAFSDADWEREMNKPPSVRAVAEFATKNGIMWSWDEGGNTHGSKSQGGDNPLYWGFVAKEIARNGANMAWHNTYDDAGAPASLMHDFARNPKSWDAYRKFFKPQ